MSGQKWYLISSLDDHSRRILYADLWEKETSWSHIAALQSVVTQFGCPLRYYVDNHSIFRFVERRDSFYQKTLKREEEAKVQWKMALEDLGIDVTYALSPAAKGKIERPYQWLQDHIVRTCARERITRIEEAREILYEEVHRYNYKRVHSTTQEIPVIRYEQALEAKRTLFRPFEIPKPFEALEDLFCYRTTRVVNAYRKISLNTLILSISGAAPLETVELRISFNLKTQLATIRIWYKDKLIGKHQVKPDDLKGVHF